MHLLDPVTSAELGWFFARLIPLLRSSDPRNNISIRLRPFMGPNFRDGFRDHTPGNVANYFATDGRIGVLILDGAKTSAQVTSLINGYAVRASVGTIEGRNPWLVEASRESYFQQGNELNATMFDTLFIAGYSAGGAIGQWVLKRWVENTRTPPPRLITFGQPRAMSPQDRAVISNQRICRWMCDADPVPNVPPRLEDAPLLYLSLNWFQAVLYSTYVHSHGGFSLDVNGNATESILPALSSIDVSGSLISWYFGTTNDPSNPHWIGNYEDRLEILMRTTQPDTQGIEGGGGDEDTQNAPRRVLTRAQNATAQLVAHRALQQNQIATDIKPAVLFKAVRFNRIWCVEFGGQLFAFSGNKKRARHLARAGNDFLRSMPKQAVVDPESLLSQLLSFFNAAVLPGGPSTPPINISL